MYAAKTAIFLTLGLAWLGLNPPAKALDGDRPAYQRPQTVGDVIQRIVSSERALALRLQQYQPLVETYIQNQVYDEEMGKIPKHDEYFLGKLDLTEGTKLNSFIPPDGFISNVLGIIKWPLSIRYLAEGFASMILIDRDSFDSDHYEFKYVRREFLGGVRCLVFDVAPIKEARNRFVGRIWAEDKDYTIVRFNGINLGDSGFRIIRHFFFHFDSWRLNVGPGLWMPAYVYTEESDMSYGVPAVRKLRFKGQTRLWGYDLKRAGHQGEYTDVLIDSPAVEDLSGTEQHMSPLASRRAWERQAEDNVLERLEQAGLLAPAGEVDKVLQIVVNNIEITNKLNIQPEVRCRVLLTSPLESFSVGHTIILSRGLIDVLPDEASLAMMLAKEMGHILLGRELIDTKYAFLDRMRIDDSEILQDFCFRSKNHRDLSAVDAKAVELLKNSPYADKLDGAGLFLRALASRASRLPGLLRPHLGDQIAKGNEVLCFSEILNSAPKLENERIDQIAALPLGGRIFMDPWNGRIELMKGNSMALASAQEKMPFELSPFMPFLIYREQTNRVLSSNHLLNEGPSREATRLSARNQEP